MKSLLNLDLLGSFPTPEWRPSVKSFLTLASLVLMVGPTGSGKSTTLYSILNA